MKSQQYTTVFTKRVIALMLALGLLVTSLGVTRPAARQIHGTIFFDHNGNGLQDDGDEGLAGVAVHLEGRRNLTTVTDEAGQYLFFGLPPGSHTVTTVNLEGYLSTTPDRIGVVLGPKDRKAKVDFGDAVPISMFGAVFQDDDCDGQFAFFESGISGVDVTVYEDLDGDGALGTEEPAAASTTTDAQGNYRFTHLSPGRVIVVETDPAGYASTTPNAVPLTLMSHEASGGISVNFGDARLGWCAQP